MIRIASGRALAKHDARPLIDIATPGLATVAWGAPSLRRAPGRLVRHLTYLGQCLGDRLAKHHSRVMATVSLGPASNEADRGSPQRGLGRPVFQFPAPPIAFLAGD